MVVQGLKLCALNAGGPGLIPGQGRHHFVGIKARYIIILLCYSFTTDLFIPKKYIREGNGNPLQYSCLENPMDRGAW